MGKTSEPLERTQFSHGAEKTKKKKNNQSHIFSNIFHETQQTRFKYARVY